MPEKENRVEVEIAGEPYVLRSDAPAEHIERVAHFVNQKIKEVRVRNARVPLTKAVVAAALNIADEYLRLKDEYDNMVKLLESDVRTRSRDNRQE